MLACAAPRLRAQSVTPGQELEGVAAVVGADVILRSELTGVLLQWKQQFPTVPDSVLREQALQVLIDQKLLYVKAVEDSVQVTDDEVKQEIDFKLQQIVQFYGSEKRAEETYGKSLSQIRRDYYEDVKKNIMGERWKQQKLSDQPRITRQDVETFFAKFHDTLAAQKVPLQYDCAVIAVGIKPSPAARDSARLVGQRLLDSLKSGASFADLAKRYSEDPSSAVGGGDLGFQKRGIFVKEFDQVAFGLKEGQTSGLVETMFGIHIIQVIERRGEEVRARHILIKIPKTKNDETTALDSIARLRARIVAGAPFDAVAKTSSDDMETRPLGGDLGPLPVAAFPGAVGDAIKALKPAEISAPVSSPLSSGDAAYKIFLLKRVIPEHAPALETDFKQIERVAMQYQQQQSVEALMRDVRKQVYWAVRK